MSRSWAPYTAAQPQRSSGSEDGLSPQVGAAPRLSASSYLAQMMEALRGYPCLRDRDARMAILAGACTQCYAHESALQARPADDSVHAARCLKILAALRGSEEERAHTYTLFWQSELFAHTLRG